MPQTRVYLIIGSLLTLLAAAWLFVVARLADDIAGMPHA